ncbi:MAG TPA: SLBB domain-containing protein [Terriglobales bacterium]
MFAVLFTGISFSQTLNDPLSQGSPQDQVDCGDPSMAGNSQCAESQNSGSGSGQSSQNLSPVRPPVLTNSGNGDADRYAPGVPPPNPSQNSNVRAAIRPRTEFEQMVADSVGRPLPLFGQSLFLQSPSTFSPIDWMQVPSDYVIGPGDELQIEIWGQVQANLRVTVDRAGEIYIPQVGQVSVAGVHDADLKVHLKREFSKIFKNFDVSANIGRLRSIQVLIVGNARYPGTYTISSLSTLVNAIFASGGPAPQGSLRRIQVRRDGATITDFDLYDLLIKGDKSKDVRLQSGDVIYIPPVGPLVAISGSVNTPAIYELKDHSSLQDLIEISGGLSTVADSSKITIDRVVDHQARKTLEFPYDEQSRVMSLEDGDIVRVLSIVPRFEDTVTLRGNVANPGRYPWKPGMRISDLIPNAQALLTRGYWRNRAAIVSGLATEYPIRTAPAENNLPASNQQSNSATRYNMNVQQPSNGNVSNELGTMNAAPNSATTATQTEQAAQQYSRPDVEKINDQNLQNQQNALTNGNGETPSVVRDVAEDLRRSAPEINWDYAVIQRVNPENLSSKLIWMSPRKAIIEHDENSNLELKAGDIVTIFSQQDINVPQTERSQYVILEGEVARPGVYKLEPNETLRSVLQRAGGLTPNAYIYGSLFTRESARVDEQKSLDQLTQTMEVQIRQSAVSVAASSAPGDLPQMQAAQEAIIGQLRRTRATGRVALPIKPGDASIGDFPNMVLEDDDRLVIPHTPSTVSVVGDVYNPGSFIYEPRNDAGNYLEIAGKGKPQSDLHHAFVLRANGIVVAANNVNGAFSGNKFERIRLYPGDQIVVPYKLPTGAFIRGLRDWTQIGSQLALTAAALAVLAP